MRTAWFPVPGFPPHRRPAVDPSRRSEERAAPGEPCGRRLGGRAPYFGSDAMVTLIDPPSAMLSEITNVRGAPLCSHFGTKSRRLRSCVRKCDYSGMGMRRIEPGRLNAALVAILREELGARGWSVRQLAERSGIPRTRTHGTLVGERPLNVDELTAFRPALGARRCRAARGGRAGGGAGGGGGGPGGGGGAARLTRRLRGGGIRQIGRGHGSGLRSGGEPTRRRPVRACRLNRVGAHI